MTTHFIVYVFLTCIQCITITSSQQVVRQNIGLIFEQLPGQLITGHDNHQLILAVPYTLPSIPHQKPPIYNVIRNLQLPSLSARDNNDAKLLQQAADLDRLIGNIDTNIINTMKNIMHFLSDPINTRPKRAILAFLGELFKSVFGLATVRDMDSIINVINHLDAKIGTLADTNVETARGLHKVNQRHQEFLDVYIKEQDAIQEALLNITYSIDSWSDDFTTTLSSLHVEHDRKAAQTAVISAQTVVLLTRLAYQQGLAKIENSLRLLSTGILAPDMIRPTDLADKLNALNTQLKINNPGSEVTIIDTAYYYSQPVALYTYSRTHLYIHINIIISATDSAFNLYQIISTDVPINTENTTSIGSTKLHTENTFLAVNEAETLYLEMTNSDLLTCTGQILKVCSRTIPRIRSDRPTCLIAAFTNSQAEIARLCTFQIHPLKPITTRAIAIDKDKYLITTNQEYYHVICQSKTPITKRASAYSVVGVPCNCHLQFDGLYLPNTNIPCNKSTSTHFLMHAANIPVIMALSHNTSITPSSLHIEPIHMSHLHTQAIVKAIAHMHDLPQDVTMDLTPFTTKILSDAEAADITLHTPLQTTTVQDNIHKFFADSTWNYIIPILSIINAVITVVLIFKVMGRQAIFTAIPQVAAKPFNISWKLLPTQTKSTQKPTVHLNQYIDAENIFTLLTIAISIYGAIKIFLYIKNKITSHCGKTNYNRKTNPTVTLKIYSTSINYTIPLVSLPHEMDAIQKGFTPHLVAMDTKSFPLPRINMTWSGPLTFNIHGEQQMFYLPNHIILPQKAIFTIIPALKKKDSTTALILKTTNQIISLHPTDSHNDNDSSDDDFDKTTRDPKDMTTAELLTAVMNTRTELGNEN